MEAAAANLERRIEAVVEAAEISERGMKDSAKEAKVKAVRTKSTAFLSFLVVVRIDRCTIV